MCHSESTVNCNWLTHGTNCFLISESYKSLMNHSYCCPVGWDCRIHQQHLCRGVRPPPMSVLDMTQNSLMVRFQ